jgi:exonuclease III
MQEMNIATWNLCLGLSKKKDYIREILAELKIDILNLQETKLNPTMNPDLMCIKGYKLEIEQNDDKVRTATYIRKDIDYKRRKDLEMKNGHMIVIDLGRGMDIRIMNIYRPLLPKIAPERQFFWATTGGHLICHNIENNNHGGLQC